MIPYSRQWIDEEDIQAVIAVLRSDWLTQGPTIKQFERAVAEYCGAQYAVAVSSGTSALHLACLSAGLGAKDTLWTSPNTFVASANCALYCGAMIDFVDIDPITYNISVNQLKSKLSKVKRDGGLPKIIVPVHFAGQSCEMEEIYNLGRKYNFTIIEDACHAIGGSYKGIKIGACRFSDMTVFSFHPVKLITTGEGGMILTNRKDLYEKLILLRTHGITRDCSAMTCEPHGPWYYQQIDLGFNYRITDIQASLGVSQMKRIDEFVKRRHMIADKYNSSLKDLSLTLPYQHSDTYSAYHLYVIRLKLDKIKKSHRQIFEELRQRGIGVNLHYIPVHTQPYYQKLGFKLGDFPQAEKYYQEAISLPIYYGLTDEKQDFVIDSIRDVIG